MTQHYFDYENLALRYEPFPIGLASPLIESTLYSEMVANWPSTELFKQMPRLGNKFALSEKFNRKQYYSAIRSTPVWKDFYKWIKSRDFVYGVMDTLLEHHIDLGYAKHPNPYQSALKTIKSIFKGQTPHRGAKLSARFEFQMMPANGGHILPHTDTPAKIVTLVVSILDEEEWDPSYGGGTVINRPKDARLTYNQLNRQSTFDDMEVIDTFPFEPNQAVIFVKTFNSWHSVRPMTGPAEKMRKTLIINIEVPK